MKVPPFLPLLAPSVVLFASGAYAGPLQFEIGLPLDAGAIVEHEQPPAKPEPGEIRRPAPDVEELWQGDRKIFSAKKIINRYYNGSGQGDGTWIVFAVTLRGGYTDIWLITPEGKSRKLSENDISASNPLISPDGATLAFNGSRPDSESDFAPLYLCDTKSGEIIKAVRTTLHLDPGYCIPVASSWSSDSRQLIIAETSEKEGAILRLLTLRPATQPTHPLKFRLGPARRPKPGPDGKYPEEFLAARALPGEIRNPSPQVAELWQGDRKIFSAHTIEGRSFSGSDPATGTWVVAAVTGDRPPMGSQEGKLIMQGLNVFFDASPREIYLIPPDGKPRRISLPETDATDPLISPDGRTVAFCSSHIVENGTPTEMKLYLYDVVSGEIAYVTANEDRRFAGWLSPYSWSAGSGTLIFRAQIGEEPSIPLPLFTLKLLR